MVWSISFLILSIAVIGGNALTCHNCWYNSPEVAKKLLYDKLQATPRFCENHNYCEGKWCVQRLDGTNISFFCANHSPLDYLFIEEDIMSQCQAFYSSGGVAHAVCYCRGGSYCNDSRKNIFKRLIRI
uniref:Uncharacterized protein n=1 Tax=Panagrolaimus sp. PS1159 TaxID=55785 RepID=A0AC35FNG6_9BILA